MTPEELLLKAVKDRHYNGVRRAIEARAKVNAPDDAGWTSLHHAAYHGFDDIIDLLLSHADIDAGIKTPQQETARDLAFLNCHDEIVRKLDACQVPTRHLSRVTEPKATHADATITTKGLQRPLFD